MARLARAEVFDPSEIVAVHLIGETVRSCYLMGFDERSSKNCDHRKRWLEEKLKNLQRDEEAGCYNCRCRNMKNPTRESIDASHD